MIVIDVGCARYGGDYSIERLLEWHEPRLLWGFDPQWDGALNWDEGETHVVVSPQAAWTFTGHVAFAGTGLGGHVADRGEFSEVAVECVDLARFILDFQYDEEVVLKVDAEGAEYALLEHLIEFGAAERLTLAWVEWHGSSNEEEAARRAARRQLIEASLRCPVQEWRW